MSNPDFDALRHAVEAKKELFSIFDRIKLENAKGESNHLHTRRVLTNNNIVPETTKQPAQDIEIEFQKLDPDLQKLEKLIGSAQSDTFISILQKYSWRIGDPANTDPSTASFCDTFRIQKALENAVENSGYLLVKGDLSGIQNYIYGGIQPKNAGGQAKLSKKLRGRSALVAMLTDFLANAMLHELGFPNWHLLFAGGGHFNLILPFSEKLEAQIEDLEDKIAVEMRRAFGDTLDLVVAAVRCDLTILENAGSFFEKLNAKRETKKYQQHPKSLNSHFYPKDELSITERNLLKKQRDKLTEDLGTVLPKRKLLVETVSSQKLHPEKKRAFEVFDFHLEKAVHQLFLASDERISDWNIEDEWENVENFLMLNKEDLKSARVLRMNDTQIFPDDVEWGSQLNIPVSFGFRFLGKYVPPHRTEDRPKTFEELAFPDPSEGEKELTEEQLKKSGLLMLASMRLDVDDLGCIFSHGFGKNVSLSHVVALSREMHYFFTAYFDHLAEENGIYVVYAGGDDAFVVGRWDKIIAFAAQLRDDFQKFVHKNEDVHFSAGIFMGDPKYPVERFFRDAGRLEKEAKFPKIQVNVFSRNLPWHSFKSKIEFGTELFEALKKPDVKAKRKLTMAFMYRVLQLVKTSFHERSGEDENGYKVKRGYVDIPRFGRNIANMRYLFARHGYTNDEIADITKGIEHKLTTDFLTTFNFGSNSKDAQTKVARTKDFLVAFNYALYCLRFHKKLNQ